MAKKGNRIQVILECTEHKTSGVPGTSRQLKLDEIKKEITEMRDIKNKLHQIERYIGSVIYSAK